MYILKALQNFFIVEKTNYSHRNRAIEIVALEKGLDIDVIKGEVVEAIKNEERVEAIAKLRKQFHVPLSEAWRFVDKL